MKRWIEDTDAPVDVRRKLESLRAETETVSPAAQARVFSRIRGPRRNRARSFMAAGAAVALAMTLLFVLRPTPPMVGAVTAVQGDVRIEVDDDHRLVRATSTTGGRVSLATLGVLEVGATTKLERRPSSTNTPWRFEVMEGRVTAEISPAGGADGFALLVSKHEVRVVGTRFSVEPKGPESVEVTVERGTVHVTGPEVDRRLVAPASYRTPPVVVVAPDETPPTANIADRRAPVGEARDKTPPAANVVDGRAAAPDESPSALHAVADRSAVVAPDDARAANVVEGRRSEVSAPDDAPTASKVVEGRRPDFSAPDEAPPASKVVEGGRPGVVVASTEAPHVDARRPAAVDVPPESNEAAMAAYREAVEQSDPHVAAERLVIVAKEHPAVRELALHRAAQKLKSAGDCGAALPRYEELLFDYPNGALGLEARIDRLECLRALGRTSAVQVALDDLSQRRLGRHRAAELSLLRADLARERGDLEGVLEAVKDIPTDVPEAQTATFLEAWALLRLKRIDEAQVVMARYVANWPDGEHAESARKWLRTNSEKK